MSSERITIALERDDDDWTARVIAPADDELVGKTFLGGGPAWALEELGQELDVREVERVKRERGI